MMEMLSLASSRMVSLLSPHRITNYQDDDNTLMRGRGIGLIRCNFTTPYSFFTYPRLSPRVWVDFWIVYFY
jgi:hypothetical protein